MAMRTTGRSSRCRSTTPVPPGGTVNVADCLDVARAAHVRADGRRSATSTSSRSGFRRSACWRTSGWNCHQFHYATEFFADFGVYDVRLTVPTGWIVGATGVERDVTGRAGGIDARITTTRRTCTTSRGRRARTTSSSTRRSSIRRCRRWTCGCCCSRSTRARRSGTSPPTRATLRVLRRVVRPVSVRPHHDRRSRVAERRGRHGVSDALHRRHALARAARRRRSGGRRRSTKPATSSGTASSPPTSSRTAWMDEGFNTFSTARVIEQQFQPNYYVERYFGGFVPWVFRGLPLTREVDGDRLAGYRRLRPAGRAGDADVSLLARHRRARSPTTRRRSGCTRSSGISAGRCCSGCCRPISQRYAFKHPRPQDFFAVANEVSGRDLTWYFDQVYRGSQTFDYGVDFFRSDRVAEPISHRGGRPPVTATACFPVTVRVTFADGRQTDWSWDGRDRWKMFQIDGQRRGGERRGRSRPRAAAGSSTARTTAGRSTPLAPTTATRWSLTWLVWLQDQLLTYGFFV